METQHIHSFPWTNLESPQEIPESARKILHSARAVEVKALFESSGLEPK